MQKHVKELTIRNEENKKSPFYIKEGLIEKLDEKIDKREIEKAQIFHLKQILLRDILFRISSFPYLQENLILCGGCAMHFAYFSPRFTKDIDFFAPLKTNKEILLNSLMNIAFLSLKEKDKINLTFEVKKNLENFIRVSYYLEYKNLKLSIPVEIGEGDTFFEKLKLFTPYGFLYVEGPLEIVGDKILANLRRLNNRDSIKHSDIYDIFFLVSLFNLKPLPLEFFIKKSQPYEKFINSNNIVDFLKELTIKIEDKFKDIADYLSTSLSKTYFESLKIEEVISKVISFISKTRERIEKEITKKI